MIVHAPTNCSAFLTKMSVNNFLVAVSLHTKCDWVAAILLGTALAKYIRQSSNGFGKYFRRIKHALWAVSYPSTDDVQTRANATLIYHISVAFSFASGVASSVARSASSSQVFCCIQNLYKRYTFALTDNVFYRSHGYIHFFCKSEFEFERKWDLQQKCWKGFCDSWCGGAVRAVRRPSMARSL